MMVFQRAVTKGSDQEEILSMSEIRRIRHQLKIAYRGKAWHGPSLLENLDGVTAAVASQHPIAGSHSIWEIVLHIAAWETETALVLNGKDYVTLQGEDDWPAVTGTSAEAWKGALAGLESAQDALVQAAGALSDEDLEKQIPGRDFTFYVLLHGVLNHNLYHAGQIGLLRKAAV
jgi:hypothetical protein